MRPLYKEGYYIMNFIAISLSQLSQNQGTAKQNNMPRSS